MLQGERHWSLLNNEWNKSCICRENNSAFKTYKIWLHWRSWWKNCPPLCSNLFLHWTVAKIDQLENLPEMWKTVIFYDFCITNRSRNLRNQNSKFVIDIEFRKKIFRSQKDSSHSLQMKILKFPQYLEKKPPTYTIKDLENEEILGNFIKKS